MTWGGKLHRTRFGERVQWIWDLISNSTPTFPIRMHSSRPRHKLALEHCGPKLTLASPLLSLVLHHDHPAMTIDKQQSVTIPSPTLQQCTYREPCSPTCTPNWSDHITLFHLLYFYLFLWTLTRYAHVASSPRSSNAIISLTRSNQCPDMQIYQKLRKL